MSLNKYDPRLKKYDELSKTFACGENIFEGILEDLMPSKKEKLTRQSWIITGPRGAGKSHLITLLYREIINNNKLKKYWLPLIFPEEIFHVDSLYRLLIAIFENLFKQVEQNKKMESLKIKFSEIKKIRIKGSLKQKRKEKQKLAKELLDLLLLVREQGNKKFIFMLENLQQLFREQLSEDDQKLLRGFLNENPETFIIIGTALTIFQDIEHYGKPFYHYFRVRNMEALEKKEIISFLQKVSKFRGDKNINEKIEANRHYIYTYNIFTGGNPRLVLFLYELLLDNNELNTEIILEKVSELTPYFLDKTREESSQRKLILDALVSGAPAQTATEIAEYINEEQKSITEQLKRLAAEGWLKEIPIHAEGVKQKEVFFTLRDYFYRIWYQVRTGGIDESEIYCMAELAALLFDKKEIEERLQKHKSLSDSNLAVYERASELVRDEAYMANIKLLVESSKKSENKEIQKIQDDILSNIKMKKWEELLRTGEHLLNYPSEKHNAYFYQGYASDELKNFNKAIEFYEKTIDIKPDLCLAWYNMGSSYSDLDDFVKAIDCFKKAIEIKPDDWTTWYNMAGAYYYLKDYNNAYSSHSEYLKHIPAFDNKGFSNFDRYIDIARNLFKSTEELQILLNEKSSIEKKLESLTRLILLGKHIAVTDVFYELLQRKELPAFEMKKLDFFLQGYIFHLFKKEESSGELKAMLESWVRLISRMFEKEHEKLLRKVLEFLHFSLKIAGKEKVPLSIIHSLMDDLRSKGVETSGIILKILSAVKTPHSRDAQKWMADPLFKEIVAMLS